MKKLALIGAALSASMLSMPTFADVDVADTVQQGSLLIFPLIDVRQNRNTYWRITNDGNEAVKVVCYYRDTNKNDVDFSFTLTPNQPAYFDALNGTGTFGGPRFPTVGSRYGEVKCWAVRSPGQGQDEQLLSYNELSGSATVYDYGLRTAWEYSSWNFRAKAPQGFVIGTDELVLDGTVYDFCPDYLKGHFTPVGLPGALGPRSVTTRLIYLWASACTQEFRQAEDPFIYTKLQFTVWNEDEIRFTGAHKCVNSTSETILGPQSAFGTNGVFENGDNFLAVQLRTESAYYRVEGVKDDSVCSEQFGFDVETEAVGLVGIQGTVETFDGGGATAHSTHLNGAGQQEGSIYYDPELF